MIIGRKKGNGLFDALIVDTLAHRNIRMPNKNKAINDRFNFSTAIIETIKNNLAELKSADIKKLLSGGPSLPSWHTSKTDTLFLMMNLSLLFLGCFLETQSIILLMTPILLPLCVQLGMHPVALGLIIVVNTSIGMITPPMAVNLYVASSIAGVGIERITIKILPYLFALIAVLIFVTYFPQALMWIPTLVGAQ